MTVLQMVTHFMVNVQQCVHDHQQMQCLSSGCAGQGPDEWLHAAHTAPKSCFSAYRVARLQSGVKQLIVSRRRV